ncbi:tetratricopeptide repeat protein [Nodularia sp. LEGE 06071]|nr:tetratricopeptide repeat protein [Nodularia sp. LEGE 06071]
MDKQVQNSRQQHIFRVFSYLLPNLSRYSLTLLLSVVLLSDAVGATAIKKQLQIAQQSDTTQPDATGAAAEKLFEEGMLFYRQGTAESVQQAIVKWQEALKLWQQIDDKYQQALTLLGLGYVHNSLGEKQQALSYFNQALALYRAVENKGGEATTLNSFGLV